MIDIQNVNFVKEIIEQFGIVYGIITLLFVLVLSALLIFFNYRLKSISEEISNKTLILLKNKIEILQRDEQIRTNYLTYISQKAFEKQIDFFNKINTMYFKYQKSWLFDKNTDSSKWKEIEDELMELKKEIFINSILLGANTQNFADCVATMWTGLSLKRHEVNDPKQSKPDLNDNGCSLYQNDKCYNQLSSIEQWINVNFLTNISIPSFDYSKKICDSINKMKSDFIESQIEKQLKN